MQKKNFKKRDQTHYRLRYQVRKLGIRLNAKESTIYHKYDEPFPDNKCLQRLINEFGYVIQYEL